MTTSSKPRAVALALFLSAAVAATSSFAQPSEPSAADFESARELYKEGKELRARGDLKGALEKFKAAHAYGGTPVTGIELGRTHMQLGELVEAREIFLSIGRMKVQPDETEKSASARHDATELAEKLRAKIATVVVKVGGGAKDVQVTVDGANAPAISGVATRRLNPGPHTIVARSAAQEKTESITLGEGETKEIGLTLAGTDAARPEEPREPSASRPLHVVTWIGAGVAVIGVATGAVTGIMALGRASSVDDMCSGLRCPESAREDVESGRTLATISTIGFIAAGVGVALAAAGYFVLSPRSLNKARWEGLRATF